MFVPNNKIKREIKRENGLNLDKKRNNVFLSKKENFFIFIYIFKRNTIFFKSLTFL